MNGDTTRRHIVGYEETINSVVLEKQFDTFSSTHKPENKDK